MHPQGLWAHTGGWAVWDRADCARGRLSSNLSESTLFTEAAMCTLEGSARWALRAARGGMRTPILLVVGEPARRFEHNPFKSPPAARKGFRATQRGH